MISPELRQQVERVLDDLNGDGTLEDVIAALRARCLIPGTDAPADEAQAQNMHALGQLAGGIAHAYGDLFTTVSRNCQMLQRHLRDGQVRDLAIDAIEAAEQGEQLMRQLLIFGKRAALKLQVVDLNDQLRQSERLLRRIAGRPVRVSLALSPDSTLVRADPVQLEQLLINLVTNARDAMPAGGALQLETQRSADPGPTSGHDSPTSDDSPRVELFVRDTGLGMTTEVQARIFEPFFTTKKPVRALGLGLPVVLGIAQQSEARLYVHSEPGLGSTFRVSFPAAMPPLVEARRTPSRRERSML